MTKVSRKNTALILVGGQGTRLKSLFPNTPKPLVPLGGEVFLDRLLQKLIESGIEHIFLLAGYLPEKFAHYHLQKIQGATVHLIVEDRPLGSAGAVALGYQYLKQHFQHSSDLKIEDVLVVNGDTWYGGDIAELQQAPYQSDYFIGVCYYDEADRYGLVDLDSQRKILNFHEKKPNSAGWVNSGYMVLSSQVLDSLNSEHFSSLEKDVYPLFKGEASYLQGHFYDYGTPDSYYQINKMFWLQSAAQLSPAVLSWCEKFFSQSGLEKKSIPKDSLSDQEIQFVEQMLLDPYIQE